MVFVQQKCQSELVGHFGRFNDRILSNQRNARTRNWKMSRLLKLSKLLVVITILTEIRRLDKTEHEGLRVLQFYYVYLQDSRGQPSDNCDRKMKTLS